MPNPKKIPMHMPPIAALRALAAAARHLSFTKAADELNVTQSAVSHQIRHIEDLWDLKLFERRTRRLELTHAGERLSIIVDEFLSDLTAELETLKADAGHTALRVEVMPSLAVKWLVPRLSHFRAEHPEVDVWMSTHHDDLTGLDQNEFDAVIRLGDADYPRHKGWYLMRDYVFPVARPRFIEEHGMPATPADLCKLPLLLRFSGNLSPNWQFWFSSAGVAKEIFEPALQEGTRFPDTNMAIQAAFEGEGVALARSAHVWEDIQTGRLIRLFDITCPSDVSVDLVCRPDRAETPAFIAFRDWLMGEAVKSQAVWDAAENDCKRETAAE